MAPRRVSAAVAVRCDVARAPCDLVTVETLARIALAATRAGWRLELENAGDDLRDLIELAGLGQALLGATPEGGAADRTGGTASPSQGRT